MTAARNAEPIPNATVAALLESGRSISGRIGISLASTVSRVIAVPVTNSCLPLVLAGLDGGDLVLPGLEQGAVHRGDPGDGRVHEPGLR